MPDRESENGRLFAPDLGDWLRQRLPDGFCIALKEEIDRQGPLRVKIHEWYQNWNGPKVAQKNAPRTAKTPITLKAFEGTVELLSQHISHNKAMQDAIEIFKLWGIPMDPGAVRVNRHRSRHK